MDLTHLTTPESVDWKVKAFCKRLSRLEPIYVDVQPELWSRQSTCEMNVAKLVREIGGAPRIGYKIWYLKNIYVEAERHVVLESGAGLRDPTFNADGEMKVLFVPDDDPSRGYEDRKMKIREGFTQQARSFAAMADLQEKMFTHRMSNEESWARMLTYERWLAGERMPNLWAEPGH